MVNPKIEKTLDFIDIDPKYLFSILKKYIIHLIIFVTLITMIVLLASLIGGITLARKGEALINEEQV